VSAEVPVLLLLLLGLVLLLVLSVVLAPALQAETTIDRMKTLHWL